MSEVARRYDRGSLLLQATASEWASRLVSSNCRRRTAMPITPGIDWLGYPQPSLATMITTERPEWFRVGPGRARSYIGGETCRPKFRRLVPGMTLGRPPNCKS